MHLKRGLNFFGVFSIATGAMISSGIFILPGIAYAKAGSAVIISYLLAGLFSLSGMLSIIEMTTAMPKAGGDCFSIIRSLGPAVGTSAGLLSWFSLSMKSAFALLGIFIFTNEIIPVNIKIIAVFFCLIFFIINIIGIKEAGRPQVILVAGLILLIIFYITMGIPHVKLNNLEPFIPKRYNAVFTTAGFVFVAYGGLLKKQFTTGILEKELKNILRERDGITPDKFDDIIENCIILDIEDSINIEDFFKIVSRKLSQKINIEEEKLYSLLLERENESSTILSASIAIPHIIIEGKEIFDILLARSKNGIIFSKSDPFIHAVFVLIGTKDERNFHLKALSYIVQIIHNPLFIKKWIEVKTIDNLRDIILLSKRKR